MKSQALVKMLTEMLMVRRGELLTPAVAEERARNIATVLMPLVRAASQAECWLKEHGANYTSDCGGLEEPGLAELLKALSDGLEPTIVG